MLISMPSENNNRRSSVLRFDSDSSHFVLSTPAGDASPSRTSPSLASVAHDDVQLPLPRPSPPDAAQEAAAAAISITLRTVAHPDGLVSYIYVWERWSFSCACILRASTKHNTCPPFAPFAAPPHRIMMRVATYPHPLHHPTSPAHS